MSSTDTVSADLGLRLITPQQTIVPLEASFFYSGEDPYAVRLAFRAALDETVEWIFARDLLSDGIEGGVGIGDVAVWPSARSCGVAPGGVLHIKLTSPFGQAHFEGPAGEIVDFLRRTYQVVPIGEESARIDIGAELHGLLGQGS